MASSPSWLWGRRKCAQSCVWPVTFCRHMGRVSGPFPLCPLAPLTEMTNSSHPHSRLPLGLRIGKCRLPFKTFRSQKQTGSTGRGLMVTEQYPKTSHFTDRVLRPREEVTQPHSMCGWGLNKEHRVWVKEGTVVFFSFPKPSLSHCLKLGDAILFYFLFPFYVLKV